MTANLISLNSPKAEIVHIELKKQLDKIHNSSLNTIHSARTLASSSMNIIVEHLTFTGQTSALFKSCYYHI